MPQPVVHFEIGAKDQTKITGFYSRLFGWEVTADNPMNYGLANTKHGELGGTPVQPAMEIPGMGIMVGMFQDPEGNRFGVVQPLYHHS